MLNPLCDEPWASLLAALAARAVTAAASVFAAGGTGAFRIALDLAAAQPGWRV
jgi:hypothetical protein